jgi:hypothetical protein
MAVPLINGVAYGWGNVQVILFGTPLTTITKIEYNHKQNKENIYGAGYEPVARGYGRVEYSGSIEMKTDEWKRIISASPGRNPLDIAPFDIQVVMGGHGTTPTTDKLKMVEFLENPLSTSEGDTSITVTIPIIIGTITR